MNWLKPTALCVMLAAVMACNRSQPPIDPEPGSEESAETMSEPPPAHESPEAVPTTPAPAVSAPDAPSGGTVVAYTCDDGSSLSVTYDEYSAMVRLPSGGTTLSRAESKSSGGADAYLGEELSLYRDGNLVQLHGAGKPRACTAQAGG